MRNRQPTTNDEIKEYVEQILHGADLEKITMKMVYNQVCSHYPDIDLAEKKDFIRSAIKLTINMEPTIAQMEKLVKFLEENPEIAKGTGQANNAHERLQTTQKWEAIAKELNLMGGANGSSYFWEDFWNVLISRLSHIIADRKSETGARGGIIEPYTAEMMERMIILLERLGNEEIPARRESPSTTNVEPTIAQMEKLMKFLEENPEIATGTEQANNAHESLQTTQKWEAIANELNMMGGANRSGHSWAELWYVSRSHLNHIIADRKSATGARGGVIQPYTPEMMERMIMLLEGLGIDEIPARREAPSTTNVEPTIAQMEKLMKFLEENPEIATGTEQANNAHESLQTTQKWEAIANELNMMGGANRSGHSWAELWYVSRSHLNHIIADRKSATGARGGVIQPYTPEMMERMIMLLEGLGIDEIPARREAPSDDEIKNSVKQILEGADLEQITMKMVCQLVYSHYPGFDLTHKKDFIKSIVKSLISS